MNRRQMHAQTYFFYVETQFYQRYLKNEYKRVNDNESMFVEKVVYEKLTEGNSVRHCGLFSKTPLLTGKTGSYGIVMKRIYLKVKIRNVERFFCNLLNIKTFFY